MGAMPFWFAQDVWCSTVARTSASRVASRSRTSLELSEGSLGGTRACAGVHKRTSSNDPSLSTISFVVGIPEDGEMRIYPLSPLLNTLTVGITDRLLSLSAQPLALTVMSVSACPFYGSGQPSMVSHSLFGQQVLVVPTGPVGIILSTVGLADISIGNEEIIDKNSSCIDLEGSVSCIHLVFHYNVDVFFLVMNIRCE